MKDVVEGARVRPFNLLSLETSAVCNRSCVFCPNHKQERPDELMPWELIEKVFSELGAADWSGSLNSFMYNEPMRDARILDIARLATQLAPRATFMVSTNGDYLRGPETMTALFEAGVRCLHVNVYSEWDLDEEKRERGVAAAAKRYAQLQQWAADVPSVQLSPRVYDRAPRGARRVYVEAKYGATPQDKKIGERFEIQNRSGNIRWMKPSLREPLQKMCVRPFRNFNVNWRGDALLCCNDYRGALTFGNVRDSNIFDLWNSEKMNAYRLLLQNKRRDAPLCATCDYGGGHYQHNVDRVTFGAERDEAMLARTGRELIRSLT